MSIIVYRYYKCTAKEESDIALIRLFECFMETAPQKILQISIILMQENQITGTFNYLFIKTITK